MTWDEMICNHEFDGVENHVKSMIGLYHVPMYSFISCLGVMSQ